ncbi:hypothetical protein LTR66_015147, partial [Elasticomyces elasticus]
MWKKGKWDYESNGLDGDQTMSGTNGVNGSRKSGRTRTVTERAKDAAESGEFSKLGAVFKSMGAAERHAEKSCDISDSARAPSARKSVTSSVRNTRSVSSEPVVTRKRKDVLATTPQVTTENDLPPTKSINGKSNEDTNDVIADTAVNHTLHTFNAGNESRTNKPPTKLKLKIKFTAPASTMNDKDQDREKQPSTKPSSSVPRKRKVVPEAAPSTSKHVKLAPKAPARSSDTPEDRLAPVRAKIKYVQPKDGRRPRPIVSTMPEPRRRSEKVELLRSDLPDVEEQTQRIAVVPKMRPKDSMDAFNEALRKALGPQPKEIFRSNDTIPVDPSITETVQERSNSMIMVESSPEVIDQELEDMTEDEEPEIGYGSVAQLFKEQAQKSARTSEIREVLSSDDSTNITKVFASSSPTGPVGDGSKRPVRTDSGEHDTELIINKVLDPAEQRITMGGLVDDEEEMIEIADDLREEVMSSSVALSRAEAADEDVASVTDEEDLRNTIVMIGQAPTTKGGVGFEDVSTQDPDEQTESATEDEMEDATFEIAGDAVTDSLSDLVVSTQNDAVLLDSIIEHMSVESTTETKDDILPLDVEAAQQPDVALTVDLGNLAGRRSPAISAADVQDELELDNDRMYPESFGTAAEIQSDIPSTDMVQDINSNLTLEIASPIQVWEDLAYNGELEDSVSGQDLEVDPVTTSSSSFQLHNRPRIMFEPKSSLEHDSSPT